MTLLERRLSWRTLAKQPNATARRVSLLSSFTINPLAPYIGTAMHREGLTAAIDIAPYDQIISQCINGESETAQFNPEWVVIWPRFEDLWRGRELPLCDPIESYGTELLNIVDAARHAAESFKARIVFVLPALPEMVPLGCGDAGNPLGVIAAATAAREEARRRLSAIASVLVADAESVVRQMGSTNVLDPRRLGLARIPYTEECFAAVADQVVRLMRLSLSGARKVAAVDADNTLWGGVVGEDGAEGIDLLDSGPGESFREFQRWLVELRRAGLLVAVASKNNEADLWEGFGRSEMVLRADHLAGWRVNWNSKLDNLAELAEELNLGLDSFVFIDDNPIELGEVRGANAGIGVLQMPADPANWKRDIADSGVLDRLPPTHSDLQRAAAYETESTRKVLQRSMSQEEYLASLEIGVNIAAPTSNSMARLTQLIAKTNQFVLGGPRPSASALEDLVNDARYTVRTVSARDRFGDYGIVGVFIVSRVNPEAQLDSFVLSCRAMGRGVEEAMLFDAVEAAPNARLMCTVHDTKKNKPCLSFLSRFGLQTTAVETLLEPVTWPAHVARL